MSATLAGTLAQLSGITPWTRTFLDRPTRALSLFYEPVFIGVVSQVVLNIFLFFFVGRFGKFLRVCGSCTTLIISKIKMCKL